jgi:alpha-tubulin suppressor-like RCC1 family protein
MGAETTPRNVFPPTIAGKATEGVRLTAKNGFWEGGGLSFSYVWERCTAPGICEPIEPAATELKYELAYPDVGNTVRVVATATNRVGSLAATSAETALVVGVPPKNLTPPEVSGLPKEGQLLTVSNGTWVGSPATAYAYRWERCPPARSCKPIEGANESSYRLTSADRGATIRASVTETNILGSKTVPSAQTLEVTAGPPVNVTAPTLAGEAREYGLLSGTKGSWAGTATITYGYQWERCTAAEPTGCTPIEGQTGATYRPDSADFRKPVRLRVIARNAQGETSASATSEPVYPLYGGTTLVSWGNNAAGELGTGYHNDFEALPVPVFGLENVLETGEGYHQGVALLTNGTVMAWGGNASGQLGRGLRIRRELTPGLVWAVGGNPNAKKEEEEGKKPTLEYLKGVTKVATGASNTLALLENGSVAVWGGGQFGQLGNGHLNEGAAGKMVSLSAKWPELVKLPEGARATSVAAGRGFALALLQDGTVRAWGRNQSRQLGLGVFGTGKEEGRKVPQECKTEIGPVACETVPSPVCTVQHPEGTSCPEGKQLSEVARIWAGSESAYAELRNGELVGWGGDASQQLGQGEGPLTDRNVPVKILGPPMHPETEGIAELAPGGGYVLARLRNGTVLGWGVDEMGQLTETAQLLTGLSGEAVECKKVSCVKSPASIPALSGGVGGEPVKQIEAGLYGWTLVLTNGGRVYAVGHDGPFKQLGSNSVELCKEPKTVRPYKTEPPTKAEEEKRAKEERSIRLEAETNLCSRSLQPVMEHAIGISAGEMSSLVIEEGGASRPQPKLHATATRESIELDWTVAATKFQIYAKTKDNLTEELEEEREAKAAIAEELENLAIEATEKGETGLAEELRALAREVRKEQEKLHEEALKHEKEEVTFAELNGKHPLQGGQYAHCDPSSPCRFYFTALEKQKKGEEPKLTPLEPGKAYSVEVRAVGVEGTENNEVRYAEIETLP